MKKILNFVLFNLFLFSFINIGYSKEIKSNVITLFDFSNSYFMPDRAKVVKKNLSKLSSAIASKKNGPDQPILFQVIPIDSRSQQGEIICEYALVKRGLMGKGKKLCETFDHGNCSTKRNIFKKYVNKVCSEFVVKTKAAKATDISGAISLASQLGNSQTDETKYIVIFSDMFEFRDKRIPVTQADLNNFHILVVCGGLINAEKNTADFCMNTQNTWKKEFVKLGAESVTFTIETGNWHQKTAKEFFAR